MQFVLILLLCVVEQHHLLRSLLVHFMTMAELLHWLGRKRLGRELYNTLFQCQTAAGCGSQLQNI